MMISKRMLPIVTLFVMLLSSFARAQSTNEKQDEKVETTAPAEIISTDQELAQSAAEIIELTNTFREAQGLPPVTLQPKLAAAAEYFANFMATEYKFGHQADGSKPAERSKKYEYDHCLISENIAYQYSSVGFSPQEVAGKFATGWENSADHRKNLVDPDVVEMGVAVSQSKKTGYYFAVQMFGRPKSMSLDFTIINRTSQMLHYQSGDRQLTLEPSYRRVHSLCRPTEILLLKVDEAETDKEPSDGAEPKQAEVLEKFQPVDNGTYLITEKMGRLVINRQ